MRRRGQRGTLTNPFSLTRTLLAQQVLLEIADTPRSPHQVAQAVGAEQLYVLDHLVALEAGELVERVDADFVATFPILGRKAQEELTALVRSIGQQDATIIRAHLSAIEDASDKCGLAESGFAWEHMQWIVLAVFVANLGVRLVEADTYSLTPPLRPDGGHRWFFGETVDVPPPEWVAGCNTSADQDGGVGYLWTPSIRRETPSLPGPQARGVF